MSIFRLHRVALCGLILIFGMTSCGGPEGAEPVRERARVSVVREGPDAVRVDGVAPLAGFAKGRDCTFIGCLEVLLESAGRRISYDDLMAVSGMSFRTQFRVDRWDVGNPDPLVGDTRLDALFESVGWKYEVRIVRLDELAEKDALHRAICRSIDAGMPVLAANIIPPEDWGIITGYRRDRTYLCRSYNDGALTIDEPAKGWPTAVVILTEKLSPPVRERMRMAAVKNAIELWEKRAVGPFAQGGHAFDQWSQLLRTVADRDYVHANFWTYICLIDARASAVRYLRGVARDFGTKQLHVAAAADFYDQEVRLLLDNLSSVPPEHEFKDSLPPAKVRNKQAEVLQSAKQLEAKAIESLKNAM